MTTILDGLEIQCLTKKINLEQHLVPSTDFIGNMILFWFQLAMIQTHFYMMFILATNCILEDTITINV
jgi:hypothetical protein